jgi:uncharacterized membrane protein
MKKMKSLKQIFLNGLFFLLPIAIAFSLFNFLFNLVTSWLDPIRQLNLPYISRIPYYEFILVTLFIVFIGLKIKTFVFKPFVNFLEEIFKRIPLFGTVYFGAKQLIHALTSQDKLSFKSVVFIEFPRKNIYSIGFLTSEVPHEMSPNKDERYFNVYIPTTPNPTTGFFIIAPKDQIIETGLTRQEAMSLIISGGIIQPERYTQGKTCCATDTQ